MQYIPYQNDTLRSLIDLMQLENERKRLQLQNQQMGLGGDEQFRAEGLLNPRVESINQARNIGFWDKLLGESLADTKIGQLLNIKKPTEAADFNVENPAFEKYSQTKTPMERLEVSKLSQPATSWEEAQKAREEMKKYGLDLGTALSKEAQSGFGSKAATLAEKLATVTPNENAGDKYLKGDRYDKQLAQLYKQWQQLSPEEKLARQGDFMMAEAQLNDIWGRGGKRGSLFQISGTGAGNKNNIYYVIDKNTGQYMNIYEKDLPKYMNNPQYAVSKVSGETGTIIDTRADQIKNRNYQQAVKAVQQYWGNKSGLAKMGQALGVYDIDLSPINKQIAPLGYRAEIINGELSVIPNQDYSNVASQAPRQSATAKDIKDLDKFLKSKGY